jgi:hypothetical protein
MIETPADYRSFIFLGVTIRRSSSGQAFHYKSSHFLRQAVGFSFQSFTQAKIVF